MLCKLRSICGAFLLCSISFSGSLPSICVPVRPASFPKLMCYFPRELTGPLTSCRCFWHERCSRGSQKRLGESVRAALALFSTLLGITYCSRARSCPKSLPGKSGKTEMKRTCLFVPLECINIALWIKILPLLWHTMY